MKYLLDTDHISILQRRSGAEYATLSRRLAPWESDSSFSIISLHEQVIGAHTFISRRSGEELVRGYRLLGEILSAFSVAPVLLFDSAALSEFDRLRADRVRLATMDLRIASIALSRGLVLLTRNKVDFDRVPGLATEDWTK